MSDFWAGQRVLVAGGCGFLGSYVVRELVARGAQVHVVDNLASGSEENLAPVRSRVVFDHADVRDRHVCAHVTAGKDVVLNLAALASGMEYSRTHHGEMLVYNLLSTLGLLDAARHNHIGRYLTVSSSCVYPEDAPVPTPELPVFTAEPEAVNEGYGWAKRVQELAASYYARETAMRVYIVRPFNLYGAQYRWQSEEKAHVIPALVKRVLDGYDPVVVWGSGRQRRNFLHGVDAAWMLLDVVASERVNTPINLGFEEDVSMKELVELICRTAGVSPRIEYDLSRPEGHVRKAADATLLREVVRHAPRVSLEDGIHEMIAWYNRSFVNAAKQEAVLAVPNA